MRPDDTKAGDRKKGEAEVSARADEAAKALGNTKKKLAIQRVGGGGNSSGSCINSWAQYMF